jgi:hypothetical protein
MTDEEVIQKYGEDNRQLIADSLRWLRTRPWSRYFNEDAYIKDLLESKRQIDMEDRH